MIVRKRTWLTQGKEQFYYQADFTDPVTKKRIRPKLESKKLADAREEAENLLQHRKELAKGAEVSSVAESNLTLEVLLEKHRARPGIKEWTRTAEKIKADSLLRLFGNEKLVSSIGYADLDEYAVARKKEAGRARAAQDVTVIKEFKLLRQAMNWGYDRHLCPLPTFKIPRLSPEVKPPRCLSRKEIEALFEACGPETSHLRQVVEFAYYTGLRRSELFTLTWANVDYARSLIRFKTEKGGRAVDRRQDVVYLSPRALELVKLRKQSSKADGVYIFGVSAGGYVINKIQTTFPFDVHKVISKAAKRAGIANPDEVTTRSLRHSCASHLLEAGATVPEAAAHLRHRDGGGLLLKTYAHAHEEGLRRATNLLGPVTNPSQESE